MNIQQALRLIACMTALLALHTASPVRIGAQQDSDPSSSLPVTVGVEPGNSLPGGRISISGSTIRLSNAPGLDASSLKVGIIITPNGRIPISSESAGASATEYEQVRTYTLPVNSAGGYSTVVDGPLGQGFYRVKATAPDGKGIDSTTFVVMDKEEMDSALTSNVTNALRLARTAIENADQMIGGLPASPAKAKMAKKLTAIKAKIAEAPSQTNKVASGLHLISAIPEKYPETTPAFAPYFRQMGLWTAQSREEIETVTTQLDKSKKARVTCDQVDRVIESLKFAGMLLTLVGSPLDVAKNFASGLTSEVIVKEASASPRLSNDLGFQTMVGQVNKLVPDMFGKIEEWKGGSKVDFQGSLAGLIGDAVQYVGSRVFESYCEKFEGPVTASMRAEFTNGGSPWWKYLVDIEGKLVLRYAKGATGEAASVSGQFEGSGRSFKIWENAGQVLFPELMPKGAVVARVITPPLGTPYIQNQGTVAAQVLTPASFYIPVEGTIVGKNLTLRMLASNIDFTTATARGVYVFFGPGTLMVPLVTTFTLPYKDAHWILRSALGGEQTAFEVKTTGNKMTIERVGRIEKPGASNTATYTVNMQACNPGC